MSIIQLIEKMQVIYSIARQSSEQLRLRDEITALSAALKKPSKKKGATPQRSNFQDAINQEALLQAIEHNLEPVVMDLIRVGAVKHFIHRETAKKHLKNVPKPFFVHPQRSSSFTITQHALTPALYAASLGRWNIAVLLATSNSEFKFFPDTRFFDNGELLKLLLAPEKPFDLTIAHQLLRAGAKQTSLVSTYTSIYPMHYAIKNFDPRLLILLVQHARPEDLQQKDILYRTPEDLARRIGSKLLGSIFQLAPTLKTLSKDATNQLLNKLAGSSKESLDQFSLQEALTASLVPEPATAPELKLTQNEPAGPLPLAQPPSPAPIQVAEASVPEPELVVPEPATDTVLPIADAVLESTPAGVVPEPPVVVLEPELTHDEPAGPLPLAEPRSPTEGLLRQLQIIKQTIQGLPLQESVSPPYPKIPLPANLLDEWTLSLKRTFPNHPIEQFACLAQEVCNAAFLFDLFTPAAFSDDSSKPLLTQLLTQYLGMLTTLVGLIENLLRAPLTTVEVELIYDMQQGVASFFQAIEEQKRQLQSPMSLAEFQLKRLHLCLSIWNEKPTQDNFQSLQELVNATAPHYPKDIILFEKMQEILALGNPMTPTADHELKARIDHIIYDLLIQLYQKQRNPTEILTSLKMHFDWIQALIKTQKDSVKPAKARETSMAHQRMFGRRVEQPKHADQGVENETLGDDTTFEL